MSEIIYGKNPVRAAVESGRTLEALYVQEGHQDLIAWGKRNHLKYRLASNEELNRLAASTAHQGVVASVADYKTYDIDELLTRAQNQEFPLIVALDGLEDPHNLGAILRTCEASGTTGVIYPKNRSVKLSGTVAKVSTGAIETVPCAVVTNLVATLETLKARGFWIVGAEHDAQAVRYDTLDYDFPTVLVLGSEGKGLSRLVREHCDHLVEIPMVGTINSLNVSVAAGLLIYQIRTKQGTFKSIK